MCNCMIVSPNHESDFFKIIFALIILAKLLCMWMHCYIHVAHNISYNSVIYGMYIDLHSGGFIILDLPYQKDFLVLYYNSNNSISNTCGCKFFHFTREFQDIMLIVFLFTDKKSEARSRVDRDADNHQLLQLEEKDVVSSVATVLSDLCGPGEWMPMAKLHSEVCWKLDNR